MNELCAVRAMLSRDYFVRYSSVLLDIKNLEPEHKQIIKTIEEYWQRYPDQNEISLDELRSFFPIANPAANKVAVAEILNQMEKVNLPNSDLVRDILNHFVEIHMQSQMSLS